MKKTIARAEKVIMPTYKRFPIVFDHGDGCTLTDINGKKYIDFVAGIAVDCLGHNHKGLNQAIAAQCQKMIHVSNLYYTQPQIEMAELVCQATELDQAFFCNSGAEANEAAMKLARIYAKQYKAPDAMEIIAMDHSFHGRTYGALTATGNKKYQKNLDPLLPGVKHVPFNDFKALEACVSDKTCAIMIEVIQGEGGIYPVDYDYLQAVRKLCDDQNIVLIFDEVQCGMGRSGKMFAYQHYNLKPDIVAMAKAIAGGLPMGAIAACSKVSKVFVPGTHASTFGGNPLVSAASRYVLKTLMADGFLDSVQENGNYLKAGLEKLQEKYDCVKEVRGKGLMLGMELKMAPTAIIEDAIDQGLLLVGAGNNTIRFVPPLIISKNEIDQALKILNYCLQKA